MLKIIPIIILILLSSCIKKRYEKKSFYESGKLKEKFVFSSEENYETNMNYKGFLYYENGSIKNIVTIKNGLKEESYLSYYPNGNLQRVTMFKMGKQHGMDRLYDSLGQIVEENLYINNIPMLKMKVYNSNEKIIHFYFYVENDSLEDNGLLIFNGDNNLSIEESFYYSLKGKDTINYNEEYSFFINTYTFGENNRIERLLIGDFDENYNFIDSTNIKSFSSETNTIKCTINPQKSGNNLILGKIYVKSDTLIDNNKTELEREFILCKDFFVKD